jgi:O-antigen/teichoic acid export membrane protein
VTESCDRAFTTHADPPLQTKSPASEARTLNAAPAKSRIRRVRNRVFGHRDLWFGSFSLMGSTIVTSAGGFVFWIVVARYYTPTEMGHGAAIVSGIIFLGVLGVFGLGTMLVGQLARDPARIDPLLPAAFGASAILSAALASCFALAVALLPTTGLHHAFENHWSTYVLFVVAVAVSSWVLVLDQASLGIASENVQMARMVRNTVAVAARIPLIILTAIFVGKNANYILIVWVVTEMLSVAVIALPMRRRGVPVMRLRSPRHLRGFLKEIAHYNTLTMSQAIPRLIVPVIVATFAGGATTAVFYVCWMIASFLYLVPTHMSTTLFAISAGDADILRRKARVTILISIIVGCIGMPLLAVLARSVLSLFGPEYAFLGSTTLAILTLLYIPTAIKEHYVAISRARDKVRSAGILCAVAALVEIVGFATALKLSGRTEFATVVLCVILFVEGLFMLPTVIAALRGAEVLTDVGPRLDGPR